MTDYQSLTRLFISALLNGANTGTASYRDTDRRQETCPSSPPTGTRWETLFTVRQSCTTCAGTSETQDSETVLLLPLRMEDQ
ncbi:hypothetical protein JOB18_042154 [Solea senegalensis]|uniref:Secreted protein n=1 Tax=Solea senegalensis TaxID=28829 RepID=A0AAV6PKT3_SOLSE|nr:hypothetical protein JOB18_042154 [Solea senegalensis]